jgi:hypothetical protein
MARKKISQHDREKIVIEGLESSFPHFAGDLIWSPTPAGQDPPDLIGTGSQTRLGLELTKWLDGPQMSVAQAHLTKREQMLTALLHDPAKDYRPTFFTLVEITPDWSVRLDPKDEPALRAEFFGNLEAIDKAWQTHPMRQSLLLVQTDFSVFPTVVKYIKSIKFVALPKNEYLFVDLVEAGGKYSPNTALDALKTAIDKKLSDYATPEKQAHLAASKLTELGLLVHGDFDTFAYNTPHGRLAEVGQEASAFYASHPDSSVFGRVWLYYALKPASKWNEMIGLKPDTGRVSWLAQIWPEFVIYSGSHS